MFRIIFLFIFLIVSNTALSSQKNTENQAVENAAVYYLKAFNSLHYPKSMEVKNKINIVIKNGWQADYKELEKLLNQNEICFKEFKKGVSLKKCDFNFGKKYKYLIQKEPPPFLKIIQLSELLLLKGRYLEKKGNYDEAIDIYLSLLTFSLHISQANSTLSQIISLRIEKDTYMLLKNYLNSDKVTRKNAIKISNYLEDYEKNHFSIEDTVEKEKEIFISSVQMLVDKIDSEKNGEKILEFKKEILKQAHSLADYYYGLLIKAVKTNKERDWNVVYRKIQNLQKEVKMAGISTEIIGDLTKGRLKNLNKKLANQIVKITLLISFPNIKKMVDSYYLRMKELKELKLLANMKAR
ncbi:MAG: hypothetical protein DRP67_01675 [Candidatus Omnitrophota bacterium]|nr:MAG: hypothetical protein DRP67_01675 [Candidatus Omnitrophota bacterium]